MNAALIIATGRNAQCIDFESQDDGLKSQSKIGAIPSVKRIIQTFHRAGIDYVVVVCDGNSDSIEKSAAHMNVIFLHNSEDAEMFDSVKLGLAYLMDKCSKAIITHVDTPCFSVDTVRALIAAKGSVCVPTHNGIAGYPVLLCADQFTSVSSYQNTGGLAGAIMDSGLQRTMVEVDDEGIFVDVYNYDNYEHFLLEHNELSSNDFYLDIRLRIIKDRPCYGPGAHHLLQLTDETNSLREACRRMGISYGKGRSIISLIERQLGYPMIESQQGGKTGGNSVVTEDGKKLMRSYSAFNAEAKQYLNELFRKHFSPSDFE